MKYPLLVVCAGLLFGTTGTARAFAPAGASSLSVGSARLALGGLLLGLIGLIAHWYRHRGQPRQRPIVRPGEALVSVVCGGSVMVFQATFFEGTRSNGVMVGTMLALGSAPLLAGLLEWVVLRKRPGLPWLVATIIGVGGVVSLSWTTDVHDAIHPLGVVQSITAGASFAVLSVGLKWMLGRGWQALDTAAAVMASGSVMALATLPWTDVSWLAEPRGMAVVAWLGVMTIAAAYTLNITGLTGTSAAAATTLNLSEPATATVLGIVVLGEHLTLFRGIGILAILASVILLGVTARPEAVHKEITATT